MITSAIKKQTDICCSFSLREKGEKGKQYTGFIIQPSGSKHVITRNFSRDFIPFIIIYSLNYYLDNSDINFQSLTRANSCKKT